jgi:glyoxylase-like metal-dependent hydrolase (beta-lactamase superfamily II)
MAKKLLIGLGGLLLALVVAKFFMLDRGPVPEKSTFVVDLPGLRKLAKPEGAALPESLEVITIGKTMVPRTIVLAGGGFGDYAMAFTAWRLRYADGTSVIIDTTIDGALNARHFGADAPWDAAAFGELRKAMSAAQKIVITHEHPDHLGGVASAPDFDQLVPKLMLTKAQLSAKAADESGLTSAQVAKFTPLEYSGSTALAPGVSLQAAPGHSPGTQLVYVTLANGQELLFVGDIGWSNQNITELTGKPFALSRFMLNEDRDEVANQLRALHEVAKANPAMHLVAAHDHDVHNKLIAAGVVKSGFAP